MKEIRISASAKQLSRLRNGHKVRVKEAMEGTGFNLVVTPDKYDTLSRSFSKGKGSEVQLSLDELQANRAVQGEGIFGKKFDKFLGKVGIKKQVYAFGDKIKEPVKKVIRTVLSKAPQVGAAALAGLATAAGQPELAGVAAMAGKKLGEKAGKYLEKHSIGYIDDPEAYQENPSLLLGTGMNGCGSCRCGNGLYAAGTRGRGLYASAGRGAHMVGRESHTRGIVGTQGGALVGIHPALQSQPFGTNFHQQYQLPPSFQRLHSGAGLYA